MDGGTLLEHLRRTSSNHASDGIQTGSTAEAQALDEAGGRFLTWAARAFCEPPPSGADAWTPERME